MKKLHFFTILVILLMSSCGKEAEFDKKLREAYNEDILVVALSAYVADEVSSTWHKAIYDKETPSGKYCSDFNDALEELYKNFRSSGITDSIRKHKENLEHLASQLSNPPSNRKECYDDFIEIVGETSSFSKMATSPSGSLRSYGDQKIASYERITKLLDRYKIKYGEFLDEKK